jgi:hypothetical protein
MDDWFSLNESRRVYNGPKGMSTGNGLVRTTGMSGEIDCQIDPFQEDLFDSGFIGTTYLQVFFLVKKFFWVILCPVVLGGELAVPFTRNPLYAGLNSPYRIYP